MIMSKTDQTADAPVAVRRALVSVADKTHLDELATALRDLNIEIVSTGGTARALRRIGVPVTDVATLTAFGELLDGRVKTLHPAIFAGILARRGDPRHQRELHERQIDPIDLVVVSLYPFEAAAARPDASLAEAIEQIDIGGPSLIRSAAKNFEDVAVLVDPDDYRTVIAELRRGAGRLPRTQRLYLATKAFAHVALYDSIIATYLTRQLRERQTAALPDLLHLRLVKVQDLRYGENPHQQAALYRDTERVESSVASAKQLQGNDLSFNNLVDLDAALVLAREFHEPAAVIIKHANPCGVAIAATAAEAFRLARDADRASAYGGVLAVNRRIDADLARDLAAAFLEAIVAPGYEDGALTALRERRRTRLLDIQSWPTSQPPDARDLELRHLSGAMLVQQRDVLDLDPDALVVATRRGPSDAETRALRFAWKVVKHVRSNAIVLANEHRTLGIGAGQMSRVDACRLAVMKAGPSAPGAVLASDAFFPFRDGVDAAAAAGVTAIIQPGGSIRDTEVIQAADEARIAMVFTGIRHFRH
jgi:phosphoribosylaminoimidazolecarboxamide formyltransferase/IMP cyclohydrolase